MWSLKSFTDFDDSYSSFVFDTWFTTTKPLGFFGLHKSMHLLICVVKVFVVFLIHWHLIQNKSSGVIGDIFSNPPHVVPILHAPICTHLHAILLLVLLSYLLLVFATLNKKSRYKKSVSLSLVIYSDRILSILFVFVFFSPFARIEDIIISNKNKSMLWMLIIYRVFFNFSDLPFLFEFEDQVLHILGSELDLTNYANWIDKWLTE